MLGSLVGFTILGVAEGYQLPVALRYSSIIIFALVTLISGRLAFVAAGRINHNQRSNACTLNVESEKAPSELPDKGFSIWAKLKTLLASVRLSSGESLAGGHPVMVGLLVLVFVSQLSGAMLGPFLEVYLLDEFNISHGSHLALAYVPGGILSLILAPHLGRYGDKMEPRVFLVGASLLSALSTWLILQSTSIWQISVLFLLDASVLMAILLVLTKKLSEIHANQTMMMSLQGLFTNLGFIIGPLLGGLVWQSQGSHAPIYLSIFIDVFLAVACFWVLTSYARPLMSKSTG